MSEAAELMEFASAEFCKYGVTWSGNAEEVKLKREQLQAEIGDCCWYLAKLCTIKGITFANLHATLDRERWQPLIPSVRDLVVAVGFCSGALKKSYDKETTFPTEAFTLHAHRIYALLFAISRSAGLPFEEVLAANIAKLEARHGKNSFNTAAVGV